MIRETLQEHARRNNFVRIYPSKNSDIYDGFFVTPRPSNKFLYRYLYTDEIIHFPQGYPVALHNLVNKLPPNDNETSGEKMSQTGFPSSFTGLAT